MNLQMTNQSPPASPASLTARDYRVVTIFYDELLDILTKNPKAASKKIFKDFEHYGYESGKEKILSLLNDVDDDVIDTEFNHILEDLDSAMDTMDTRRLITWTYEQQSSCVEKLVAQDPLGFLVSTTRLIMDEISGSNQRTALANAHDDDADHDIDHTAGPTKSASNASTKKRFFKLLYDDQDADGSQVVKYFNGLDQTSQAHYVRVLEEIRSKVRKTHVPLAIRVLDSDLSRVSKQAILERAVARPSVANGSGSETKHKDWVAAVEQLPFDKLSPLPVSPNDATRDIRRYLKVCRRELENSMYGHADAKEQIMRIIGQIVSNKATNSQGEMAGNVIAIIGPPGVGKTALVKRGLAKAIGKPFAFVSLGGATDSAFLEGHDYTYQGARYGRIAEILMETQTMDPVIFFDELDKVSRTPKGDEIMNCLMHLTDPTQNKHFRDKYFSGIDLDLSKAIFIFSLNSTSGLNPILLDRLKIIKTDSYVTSEKLIISESHLIKEIENETNIPHGSFKFSRDILRMLIETYTFEGGVRRLKEILTEIMMDLRLKSLEGKSVCGKKLYPLVTKRGKTTNGLEFVVTREMIEKDLLKNRRPITHQGTATKPTVGLVSGLWANHYGLGGLIPIQAKRVVGGKADDKNEMTLKLTGMQGDVMKESMQVSKSVALSYLEKHRPELLEKARSNLHIHCPDGATPKDGPSAGAAITCCILSLIMNQPINHLVAMTGEIDLLGRVTAIGGLKEKVFGAIRAGAKIILYPLENQIDIDNMTKSHPNIRSELDSVRLVAVQTLDEVLGNVFVKESEPDTK